MKYFSLFITLIMLSPHANAEFTAEETKILSAVQKDENAWAYSSISIEGMGYGAGKVLSSDLFELIQQGKFSVLDERLQKLNLIIDMPRSNLPKGNPEHEGSIRALLVLQRELNKIPKTETEYKLYSAIYSNNKEKVRNLFESNAINTIDVNKYYNIDAFTPLSLASMRGYNDIIKMLLENGAERNQKDKGDDLRTPLAHAIHNNHPINTVKLLVEAGADVDLISGYSLNSTPLAHAISSDNIEVVKYLLKKGANPNISGGNGSNALLSALSKSTKKLDPNQEAIIHLLIEKSDVNHQGKRFILNREKGTYEPKTPLVVALVHGHSNTIIEKLLAQGAKIGTNANDQIGFLSALARKRRYHNRKGDKDSCIKNAHKAIKYIGYSKNKDVQQGIASALGDIYEISIILRKKLDKKDKALFERLSKENKNVAALYQMLVIFEQAVNKQQTNELKEWSKKYDPKVLNWCFKNIKAFAETLSTEEKERVLESVKVFETKKC